MQDILPSSFVIPSKGGLHKDVWKRKPGAVDGPSACQPLAQGSTEACARKELCGFNKPSQKRRALVLALRCPRAVTGEFGGFAGVTCVVAAAAACSTAVGVLPAPDSAGITCRTADIGEGWGDLGFLFVLSGP